MRIISWSVVIGSIAAILYGGVRPLLQDMRLPEINAAQVAGTAARPAARETENCVTPAAPAPANARAAAADQPATCSESKPARP